tara:strand:+ start:32958 stop:33926 length:969 start_codon:yes stop_codon:yes gene_type:complete
MNYKPPFTITPVILALTSEIQKSIGIISGTKLDAPSIKLRKENNIKTIQSSLSIEGNTMTVAQITTLLEGKRVSAPQKDLIEVKNALEVYSKLSHYNPLNIENLLKAHHDLLKNLGVVSGQWRAGNVGIFKGKEIAHLPPPPDRVDHLIKDLFNYIKKEIALPWLIKACIFHYEFEFIHPFEDGNGRIGRLWQQLLLMKEHPIFEYIAVEEMIKNNQQDYYQALSESDKKGDSTVFIEFSLRQIKDALHEYTSKATLQINDGETRLNYAKAQFENKEFSRKQYREIHPEISTATASRDLLMGTNGGWLTRKGENNQTLYKFS